MFLDVLSWKCGPGHFPYIVPGTCTHCTKKEDAFLVCLLCGRRRRRRLGGARAEVRRGKLVRGRSLARGRRIDEPAAIKLRRAVWLSDVFLEQTQHPRPHCVDDDEQGWCRIEVCCGSHRVCGHPHAEGRPEKAGGIAGIRGAPGV